VVEILGKITMHNYDTGEPLKKMIANAIQHRFIQFGVHEMCANCEHECKVASARGFTLFRCDHYKAIEPIDKLTKNWRCNR